MRDDWITEHLGSESEPRPGFEEELGALLSDEWQGIARHRVDIQGERPMRRRNIRQYAWVAAAAAAILAVIVVVKTRDHSDSQPTGPDPTAVTTPVNTTDDTTNDTTDDTTDDTTPADTEPATTTPSTTVGDTTEHTTPATTASTVPETSTPVVTVPATLPPGEFGFAPACEESTRSGPATIEYDDRVLDSFGPLAVDPAISFQLPDTIGPNAAATNSSVPTGQQPISAVTRVERVPGGFLFAIWSDSPDSFPGTILKLVDDDGGIRWQRCLADTVSGINVAPLTSDPMQAIVSVSVTTDAGSLTGELRVVDLATGELAGTLADVIESQGIDPSDNFADQYPDDLIITHVLFAPSSLRALDPATDHLISIELATMKATAYPLPSNLDGVDPLSSPFQLQADGTPFLVGRSVSDTGVVTDQHSAAHWANDAWVTERQPLPVIVDDPYRYPASDAGVSVRFDMGNVFDGTPAGLVATDQDGAELWRHSGINHFGREGFDVATNAGTVLAVGCTQALDPSTGGCATPVLIALDASDGTTLWQKDGYFGVILVDDGYAIVSDGTDSLESRTDTGPAGWNIMDVRSGVFLDGQHWDDPATFGQGCCNDNTLFTAHFGGTVVAVNGRNVNIYFPTSGTP